MTTKACIGILANMFVCLSVMFYKSVRFCFLGKLRELEHERMWENVRHHSIETALMLTIFRDEISMKAGTICMALTISKIFHTLAKARIEYYEHTQDASCMSHLRIISLKGLLFATDLIFVFVAVHTYQVHGPSIWLFFGFEYDS